MVCRDALDALGLSRYCCRRMLMTHVGEHACLRFMCSLKVLYVASMRACRLGLNGARLASGASIRMHLAVEPCTRSLSCVSALRAQT